MRVNKECLKIVQRANRAEVDVIKRYSQSERRVLAIAIKSIIESTEDDGISPKHKVIDKETNIIEEQFEFVPNLSDSVIIRNVQDALQKYEIFSWKRTLTLLSENVNMPLKGGVPLEMRLGRLQVIATTVVVFFSSLVADKAVGKLPSLDAQRLVDDRDRAIELLKEIEAKQKELAGSNELVAAFVLDFLAPYLGGLRDRRDEMKSNAPPLIFLLGDFLEERGIHMDEPLKQEAIATFTLAGLRHFYGLLGIREQLRRQMLARNPAADTKTFRAILRKYPELLELKEDSSTYETYLNHLKVGLQYEFDDEIYDDQAKEIGKKALMELNASLKEKPQTT